MAPTAPDALAQRLLAAFDGNAQVPPPSDADPGFDMGAAYATAALIGQARVARGEVIAGRKIGFTNRTIWPLYNVDAPIWGWMYGHTVADLPADGRIPLPALPEPRIEPEIALGFARSPAPGMGPEEIAACVDWVAHGVEIVVSLYPGWRFLAPDTVAAMGMHGALWVGERHDLREATGGRLSRLSTFSARLDGPDGTHTGRGADVLGGPLHALAFLLDEIAAMPGAGPILPSEIVTTGTLTDARPIAPGQRWRTTLDGIALPGLDVTFA